MKHAKNETQRKEERKVVLSKGFFKNNHKSYPFNGWNPLLCAFFESQVVSQTMYLRSRRLKLFFCHFGKDASFSSSFDLPKARSHYLNLPDTKTFIYPAEFFTHKCLCSASYLFARPKIYVLCILCFPLLEPFPVFRSSCGHGCCEVRRNAKHKGKAASGSSLKRAAAAAVAAATRPGS